MLRLTLLFAILGALVFPAASQAPSWTIRAGQSAAVFRSDRPAWSATNGSISRAWPSGAIGLEAGAINRGYGAEAYAATDIYRTVGGGTYANAYLAVAPGADRIPRVNVLAEIYASPAPPWEVSAGLRHLTFADTQIALGTASVGRYDGPWLTRVRTMVSAKGTVAVSAAASARYYLTQAPGSDSQYVEFIGGRGQEAVLESEATEIRQSWIAAVRLQQPLGETLGVSAGVGYTADHSLSRFSADASLVVRFGR